MTEVDTHEQPPSLDELTEEECLAFLVAQPIGRLALTREDGPPLVVPVNFVLDGQAIVFRSDAGTKINLLRGAHVTFQVDWFDALHHTGWSVLVHGHSYEATHRETDHLRLEPWAPGDKRRWVRIVIEEITGRRLTAGDLGTWSDGRGYL